MESEEEKSHSELEAPFDAACLKIDAEERYRQDTEERKPAVKPLKIRIQERRDGFVRQNEEANVQHPKDGEKYSNKPRKELEKGNERIVLVVHFVAPFEFLHILLKDIHALFELVHRLPISLLGLPSTPISLAIPPASLRQNKNR